MLAVVCHRTRAFAVVESQCPVSGGEERGGSVERAVADHCTGQGPGGGIPLGLEHSLAARVALSAAERPRSHRRLDTGELELLQLAHLTHRGRKVSGGADRTAGWYEAFPVGSRPDDLRLLEADSSVDADG